MCTFLVDIAEMAIVMSSELLDTLRRASMDLQPNTCLWLAPRSSTDLDALLVDSHAEPKVCMGQAWKAWWANRGISLLESTVCSASPTPSTTRFPGWLCGAWKQWPLDRDTMSVLSLALLS